MTIFRRGFVQFSFLTVLLCQVLAFPTSQENENSIREIFSESKRDLSTPGGGAGVPLLKSPLINPFFLYPPVIPGKPLFYSPLLTPSDVLANQFIKPGVGGIPSSTKLPPFDASDPTLISAYFKAKKDEFMGKLFERLANATAASTINARSALPDNGTTATKPEAKSVLDSFFLKKKYEFLETLFKSLNVTPTIVAGNMTEGATTNEFASSTPKPTLVPPDFWFPFPKLPKTPKPAKPTKPPKAKKILKDALDTILLQSLLLDLGVDPKDASLNKRASIAENPPFKKYKSKKVQPNEDLAEFYIPSKVNPALYSAKASECLNKLFKILNETAMDDDSGSYAEPKATVIPFKMWQEPGGNEYISKMDAFLDLLIKSLNATGSASEKVEKAEKLKGKAGKKSKRSTFLDELLHRATTLAPPSTTTKDPNPTIPEDSVILHSDCELINGFIQNCCCDGKCFDLLEKTPKSTRSLIFKPFGSGYWIPQYLYAAKMGIYLDKLMDSINTAAVNEVENENSGILKRNADSPVFDSDGLPTKEVAINLIISELTDLKNNIIDAFSDGIKAQKDAVPTQKPYGPSKSFKKPFWGPKTSNPTLDPVAPIQKRIDILNDVFDKLTKIEKTLIFTTQPEYDPNLIANLTEILDLTSKSKVNNPKFTPAKPSDNPESPEYFLAKTKQYLQSLYTGKINESDD